MSTIRKLRNWACKIWTKGLHDWKYWPGVKKVCRICGKQEWLPPWPLPWPPPLPPTPPTPQPDPSPPPIPPGPGGEPDPTKPAAAAAGFLWKPKSESNGNLVVLAPPAFTGFIRSYRLFLDGATVEIGKGAGVHNGGRFHVRYAKPGGSYPAGVAFELTTDAGVRWSWRIATPSKRSGEGKIVPTATVGAQ